jgi:ssDNA-binding replication factor A large subunit
MKISELRPDMNNVEVAGEITEISAPREVVTRFGNNRVATAKIKDDSGAVSLSLWGKQIDEFKVGDKVEIKGGYTKAFRDETQVNVGKMGSLQKV